MAKKKGRTIKQTPKASFSSSFQREASPKEDTLRTFDADLRNKNDLISRANDDLKNLLNRADIAIIFLNDELKIINYTPATSDIFNVSDNDVGRSLGAITSRLSYEEIVSDAREVLRTLCPEEIEVQRDDGVWYKMQILPYLNAQNVVNGLVISFLDIDDQRKAAEKLTSVNQQLEDLAKFQLENPNPVMRVKKDGTILYANAACSLLASFNFKPGQVLPKHYQKIASKVLDTGSPHLIEAEGKKRWFMLNFVPITKSGYVSIYGNDITQRKKVEEELQEAYSKLETRVKERTAELQQANERLNEEIGERVHTEQYLRLEEARLAALLRLSQMSEATIAETAGFTLEQGIALTLSKIGFVGFLNEDESVYTLHAVSKDVVKECAVQGNPLQWHIAEAGIWADAIRKRQTLFINDYSKPHPSKKGIPAGHPPVSRLMVVPLSEGDRIVAVAGMGNKNSNYDASDARQITLLLQGMWNHAQRKRSADELKEAYDKLEQRVAQRTKELASSEEKYRSIVETANEGIVILNPEAIIIFVNKKFPDLIGYQAKELVGKPIFDIIFPDYMEIIKEKMENRKRGIRESYEMKFRRKDGSPLWVIINGSPLYDSEGKYIGSLGMHTDITAEKKLKDQLIDYANRITQVQEEERKRIAYELHDDTAQYLSILKLQLDSLLKSGEIQSPEILEKLQYLEKDAGRAMEDVRRYSHELRPGVLEHLGLQAALEQMADDVNKLKQITVKVNVEGTEMDLSEEVKLGFFRIAQEALNNCRKHARCSKAIISLKFQENRVKISISDNGVGFNPQEAIARTSLKGSMGLMSMQERAKLIRANLRIESQAGKGTIISVDKTIGN